MPNVPAASHPLVGTEQVYLPPDRDPDPNANKPPADDGLIARVGDKVVVKEVFQNWNGRRDLIMAHVYVPSTGQHTYLSAREMGLDGHSAQEPGHPKPSRSQPRGRAGNSRGGGSRPIPAGAAPQRAG